MVQHSMSFGIAVLSTCIALALGSSLSFQEAAGVPAELTDAVTVEFECAWRSLALDYAKKIQPFRTSSQYRAVFDALQLGTLCNQTMMSSTSPKKKANPGFPMDTTFYVDAIHGNDSNSGTQQSPFRTVYRAVNATRFNQQQPCTVVLREGTYYLTKGTLRLTEKDKDLTIQNYPGERAILNGGQPLKTVWDIYRVDSDHNIYVASLNGQNISDILGLQVGSQRATRARYPNASPETDLFPTGYITAATKWLPPHWDMNTAVVEVPLPQNYPGMFQNFYTGVGGNCNRFFPPEAYWCQPNGRVANTTYFVRTPSGLAYDQTLLPHTPYPHGAEGAVVNAYRDGHWFNWMFVVDDDSNEQLKWTFGGFQGAEGDDTATDWFIENVFDELDAPNEFFYDKDVQLLYYFYNGTGSPPQDLQFVATTQNVMVEISGTGDSSARGINIFGLEFTASSPTYLEPHGLPSGGDWGLERLGAILIQQAENVNISGCLFTRVDGNAIFLSGWTRHITIHNNEFVWIGQSAVAQWGFTEDYYDGTAGNQPRFTHVVGNLMHELGYYEKQSSCYFQAVSCQNTIEKNICFNMPRAGININDGFGGATTVAENLVFNSCRETQDHGPFNSWDRMPFLTEVRDGTPSVQPANNIIRHNFMVANYGANGGCVDNDDGSSFYEIHHNFFVYGGHKNDFDGHSKVSHHNVNVYPRVYVTGCVLMFGLPLPEFEDGYGDSICVLAEPAEYYIYVSGACNVTDTTTFGLFTGRNQIYAPDGNVTIHCTTDYTFDEWQSYGHDLTSTLSSHIPDPTQIVKWGRAALNM